MTFIRFYLLGFTLILALLSGCGSASSPKENPEEEIQEKIVLKPAPTFSADSSYHFIETQVKFGPRVPNTEAHQKCGNYLVAQLNRMGFETEIQAFEAIAFDGTKLNSRNIIGKFNPKATKRILLAAHWDARPFNDKEAKDSTQYKPIDGANDGASGVGVLLEIARTIQQASTKPAIGVDIIFFDSEDYGQPENYKGEYKQDMWCLGSQYWAKNKGNYQAYYGILLDMVGAKNAQFWREGTSMQFAGEITTKVWRIAQLLNYGAFFKMQNGPSITDDHTYVNQIAKIPMLDIVEYNPANPDAFFSDYHHTSKDNLEVIDKNTLKAVGQTVIQVLYNEEASIQ